MTPWAIIGSVIVLAILAGWLLSRRSVPVETADAPLTIRPLLTLPGRKQSPIWLWDSAFSDGQPLFNKGRRYRRLAGLVA